jgi:Spy/CpxP family protein refolding chaperone
MKKALAGVLAIAALAISAPVALAAQPVSGQPGPPPGQKGGGGQQGGGGPTGYEGQPGNQGGH